MDHSIPGYFRPTCDLLTDAIIRINHQLLSTVTRYTVIRVVQGGDPEAKLAPVARVLGYEVRVPQMLGQVRVYLFVGTLEGYVDGIDIGLSVFAVVDPPGIVLRVDDGKEHLAVFPRRFSHAVEESAREDHVNVAKEEQSVGSIRVRPDLQT